MTLPHSDPCVDVSVHLVCGDRGAVMIDSGITSEFDAVVSLLHDAGVSQSGLALLLNTHEHMDHIGNNGALVQATGSLVAAHASRSRYIENLDDNSDFYVHRFPEVNPRFDAYAEYRQYMGSLGSPVSLLIREGMRIDFGGVEIEVFEFPGHTPAEIGFLETTSNTLIIGDSLAPAWLPTLFLYESPAQIRRSLRRIQDIIAAGSISVVLSGHSDPMSGEAAMAVAQQCSNTVSDIESCLLECISDQPALGLGDLRDQVVTRLGKEREWRALITLHGHLEELMKAKVVRREGAGWSMAG